MLMYSLISSLTYIFLSFIAIPQHEYYRNHSKALGNRKSGLGVKTTTKNQEALYQVVCLVIATQTEILGITLAYL